MDKNETYKDNRPEFKARIRKDYNLPEGDPVVDSMLECAAITIDRGFEESGPLAEKYHDLLCKWCGKLHYRAVCQESYAKFKEEHPEK